MNLSEICGSGGGLGDGANDYKNVYYAKQSYTVLKNGGTHTFTFTFTETVYIGNFSILANSAFYSNIKIDGRTLASLNNENVKSYRDRVPGFNISSSTDSDSIYNMNSICNNSISFYFKTVYNSDTPVTIVIQYIKK